METSNQKSDQKLLIRQALIASADFLSVYLPLANAHPVDFIVEDMWNCVLPESIQMELSAFTEQELYHLPSSFRVHSEEQQLLLPSKEAANHKAEKCLVELSLPVDRLTLTSKSETPQSEHTSNSRSKRAIWKHSSLGDFLSRVQELFSEHLKYLAASLQKLNLCLQDAYGTESEDVLFVNAFMKEKKMHEVEIMAEMCARIFRKSSADVVIDLGSGKGYLSTQLSLQHCLPVIGIDSQAHNTSGAVQRAEKLVQKWDLLVNHKKRNSEKATSRDGKTKMSKDGPSIKSSVPAETAQTETFNRNECSDMTSHPIYNHQELKKSSKCQTVDSQNTDMTLAMLEPYPETHISERNQMIKSKQALNESGLAKRISKNANDTVQEKYQNDTSKSSGKNVAVTMFVNPDTNLVDLVRESVDKLSLDTPVEESRLLLTGLHTCGPLAPSMLRLFVRDDAVRAVCGVGCCYQLMQERFADESGRWQDPHKIPDSEEKDGDFPLSSVLLERKMSIGQTALNIASLALPRMGRTEGELQGKTFYPRALLQAFIKKKLGYIPQDLKKLRKLAKHASGPVDYITRAIEKLKIHGCEASEEEILEFHKQHSHAENQMAAFFQLRAILAPLVETVVLLDRLLYLLEQDCVEDAFLVQLFDPITSPRCQAIIAVKKDCNK